MEFVKWEMQTEKYRQCSGLPKPTGKIKWTGGIVDLVELIYALHESKCFNQGDIYLKDLFAEIGRAFGVDIKNFSLYFVSIKNRVKGDRTKFLDKLKRTLVNRMESDDVKK
ncbi:hypothetical protein AGMMS49525_03430 [Bacteroidia bacterium]|nr:hypothetical protein AGMMS49525_03430 [Bacteroidia bacterium]